MRIIYQKSDKNASKNTKRAEYAVPDLRKVKKRLTMQNGIVKIIVSIFIHADKEG
jgi:hypothetical protein